MIVIATILLGPLIIAASILITIIAAVVRHNRRSR